MAETESTVKNRFLALDFLRFFSAFNIVLYHYMFTGYWAHKITIFNPEFAFVKYNFLCVPVFFTISGFVILNSARHKKPLEFAIYRILRIYPALIVCCTLTYLACVILPAEYIKATPSLTQYVANIFFVNWLLGIEHIDPPYWTLVIEVHFYALIFLVMALRKLKYLEYVLTFGLLVSAWFWVSFFYPSIPYINAYHWSGLFTPGQFSFFAAGCLLYLMITDGLSKLRIFLMGFSYLLAFPAIHHFNLLSSAAPEFMANSYVATLIYAAVLILMGLAICKPVLFSNKKMWSFIGNLTYPLYLIHFTLGFALINMFHGVVNDVALICIVTASMIILAACIHLFAEKPIMWGMQKVFEHLRLIKPRHS